MAKSSGNAALYFIVTTLCFAFIIATVLAVVFGSQVPALKDEAAAANSALNKMATANERANPAIKAYEGAEGASVVGAMLKEIEELKTMISGRSNDSLENIEQDKLNLGVQVNYAQAYGELQGTLASTESELKSLEEDLKTEKTRAQQAQATAESLKREFNEARAKLQEDFNSLKSDYDAAEAEFDNVIRTLENRITTLSQQSTDTISQKNSEIGSLQAQVAELQAKLNDILETNERLSAEAVDPTRLVDGAVISVLSEQSLVYINRGRKDSMVLGVTFEVYSGKTGVIQNADGEWIGKATIEVINVKEEFSIARIIRKDDLSEVFEGDVIANVIWDPYYSFVFFVWGEFDVDRTGEESVGDRRRVVSMIEQWNGKVVKDANESEDRLLSYDVDFVVLGVPPKKPDPLPENTIIDPADLIRYEKELERYNKYNDVAAEARSLTIPILNQNRFLEMVGYHRR